MLIKIASAIMLNYGIDVQTHVHCSENHSDLITIRHVLKEKRQSKLN
ncbi:unnamed protein product [Tenebrio molitor]|jgi:hypothetical protein|nr:unnamed protein product [Tenebrio molitor]